MSFSEGLTAGSNFVSSIMDERQKALDNLRLNAAHDALVKTYGAAAGDPQAWGLDQAASESQALQPGKVENQTLTNTGLKQTGRPG